MNTHRLYLNVENQNVEGDPSMIRDVPSENYIKQWGLEHLTQLWVYFRALGAKNQKQTNGSERKFKVHPITLELFGLPPWADLEKVAVLDNRGLYMNISNQTSSLGGSVWDTIFVVLDTFQPTGGSNCNSYWNKKKWIVKIRIQNLFKQLL